MYIQDFQIYILVESLVRSACLRTSTISSGTSTWCTGGLSGWLMFEEGSGWLVGNASPSWSCLGVPWSFTSGYFGQTFVPLARDIVTISFLPKLPHGIFVVVLTLAFLMSSLSKDFFP